MRLHAAKLGSPPGADDAAETNFNIDPLACPCDGRLRVEELVIERDKVREQVQQRGLSPEPYTTKQKRQFNDREAYANKPQEGRPP